MTRRLSYSREAERDLRETAVQSRRTWGARQAGSYMRTLRDDIAALREFAMRNPRNEDIVPGLRRLTSGHHLVFYLANDERVLVARVLHERVEFGSH